MYKTLLSIIVLLLGLESGILAQSNSDELIPLRVYSSVSYMQPVKNLSKYEYGFGINSHFDYNFNKHFAARLDIGWNDVSGPETKYIDQGGNVHTDHPNMSIWEFSAGFRAYAGPAYIEGRGGYFTGIDSWGYVPAVGVVIWKLDIQVNYVIAGKKEWAGVRIGYYF